MRNVNKIIIHCSASDNKNHDNIETIRKWHVQERRWKYIGYHYIITKDGIVHICRPIHKSGAHTRGHNKKSIGICLTGLNEFSKEQFESLKELTNELKREFGIINSNVFPHNHFNKNKTCPNFDIKRA